MYCTSLWYSWTNTNIFSTVQFRTIQERGGLQKSLPGVQLPYSNSMQSTGAHRQKRARVPLKNILHWMRPPTIRANFGAFARTQTRNKIIYTFNARSKKLRKATIGFVMLIRLSVRMEQLGCQWISWRLIFEYFSKICREQSRLIKMRQ